MLLSYEYEAMTAQKKGEELDVVTPPNTIKIDITAATTKSASPAAKAFQEYVVGREAQEKFVAWGYRPGRWTRMSWRRTRTRFPTPRSSSELSLAGRPA